MLQNAIMNAIMGVSKQSGDVLNLLKIHIGMGITDTQTEDNRLDIQIRIAEIDAEFKTMLRTIASDTLDSFDEEKATRLMNEKSELQSRLELLCKVEDNRENAESRLDEICTILAGLENHPMTYDDQIVRQILKSIVVLSKEQIKVVFAGGMEVIQHLE